LKDLRDIWLENIKKIENIPNIKDTSSPAGKMWNDYGKEKVHNNM
jgi:hypothetical protein